MSTPNTITVSKLDEVEEDHSTQEDLINADPCMSLRGRCNSNVDTPYLQNIVKKSLCIKDNVLEIDAQ